MGASGDTAEVSASRGQFEPSRVVIAEEAPRVLKVSAESQPLTFTIQDLGINVQVPANDTVDVDLSKAPEGTYTFYSSSPGQRAQGLEGTLVIEGNDTNQNMNPGSGGDMKGNPNPGGSGTDDNGSGMPGTGGSGTDGTDDGTGNGGTGGTGGGGY